VPKKPAEASGSASIIGKRLRELRQEHRWTLSEVAKRTGISIGTLSKLENGKTDLNFTSVNKLASGLGLRVTELTNPATSASGQRTLTRASSGTIFQTADVDYEVLCSEISNSQQAYLRATIKAHSLDPKLPWHRHKGQEFIYVISGILVLHTELYEPAVMKAGDSILFDSSMGHHYVSQGRKDAQILITMSLEGYENVSDTLRKPTR
jgi:transcriptional regulator with XRE-family HTH domain